MNVRAGSILTGTLWSMLGIAALGLTRLAYSTLVGRTGGPERLAEVNAQLSLTLVAGFATAAATGAGASKFLALARARHGLAAAAAVRRRLARWTVCATAAAVAALLATGRWLLPGADVADLGWVAALTAAYAAYSFGKGVLYGLGLARRYSLLEVVSDAAVLVLTAAAVSWAPAALLGPLVVGYAGFAVLAGRAARRALPRPSGRLGPVPGLGRREVGGFVVLTALGMLASQGLFQAAMVVARHAAPGVQAGWYAAAMSLVAPALFVPRALALVLLPAAAGAVGAGASAALARRTRTLTRALALGALPAFAVAAMVGGPVLRLLFGPAYAGGGTTFAVLAAALWCYVVAVPAVNALAAQPLALARVPPLASCGGVLLAALVWALVGTRYGAAGVAAGYLAGTLSQAGVPLAVAARRLGLRLPGLTLRLPASLAAAVAATVPALLAQRWPVTLTAAAGFAVFFCVVQGRELAAAYARLRDAIRPRGGRRPEVTGTAPASRGGA